MNLSQDVFSVDEKNPSPAKNDCEFWSSDEYIKPPGSVTHPVIAPSWNVSNAVPSGTTILLPFVIMFSEPFVFDPLPLSVPLLSAPKIAAVAGTSLLGTIKSFHWSANKSHI